MTITATTTEEEAPGLHLRASHVAFELPHAEHTTGTVQPIEHAAGSAVDFGAEVYGIDLNNFTDADFAFISDALHWHKLLVFKQQPRMLEPHQQYRLTSSFDPDEKTGGFAHGADPYLTSHNGVDIYGIPKRPSIPEQPQVHILGRGPLPENHYGFPPGFEVQGIDHTEFHLPPHIPAEEREAGASRFYQWHWDGSLYKIPPLASDRSGGYRHGRRVRALALLDGPTRAVVENSRIEYAPHAFVWMSTARSTRLGHLLETEGLEVPLDKLPSWSKEHVCVYPMVWTNPVTGEKSLQVHGQGAFKLYLKDGPDAEERVVDDLGEVRAFMDKIMKPVLQPENIYAHPHQEQDVILWYNRALWHSITEFPKSYGPRVMHQCNIAASDHPSG
ncbi:TfdA family taurine catabolism dioxygenase TauD [Microdochium trichocladiopsis]|uniref:TfdA family taurine catabolism dioxygenase TauD n=1 Tax=Microdochium trichocladiopsis TaxID=1682393 RepID=A0A9P8XZ38_9PEZI|nr:TfdA family taurine catabolism dioxygenase TauD [Microdochium trichocladiopsis]KAH7021203.1 TfdA family taurine catabolism dioxygenase TauD [Microdochium trichocladiopsis]